MTLSVIGPRQEVALKAGPVWQSFESLRTGAATKLTQLTKGIVGTVIVRDRQYRILREDDFQELHGLAVDVQRIGDGVEVLIHAAAVWEERDDENSRQLLAIAIRQIANSPSLPRRRAADVLKLDLTDREEMSGDEDDSFDFTK